MPFFFINAWLLGAAATAAVPLVIHLLHKRRAREDTLATLRFLKAGYAANRQRLQMRHLLVLALRVSAVILIVAALARPAYRGLLFFRKGTAAVDAVIVLDNSLSMAYEEAGRTHFDKARQLSKEILRGLAPGSRVGLVVTGLGQKGEGFDREPTFNRTSIEDVIEGLEISAYGGDCGAGLDTARGMLSQLGREAPVQADEIYVITDLMRHSWAGLKESGAEEGAAVIVLDAGNEKNDNFCLGGVEGDWLTSPRGRIALTAFVESGALASSRLVEAHLEGAKRAERLVEMSPNARVELQFEVPASAGPGPRQGRVELADRDPLRADNTRYFTVEAAKPVRCLVLGRRHDGAGGDTGFFIRNALEPSVLAGATFSAARYADWRDLAKVDLDDFDAVILADIAGPTRRELETLVEFTAAGNGLVIFAGDFADEDSLGWFAGEYLGASLGPGESAPREQPMGLSSIALDHPMLAAFREGRNGNLAQARFYRRRKLVYDGGKAGAVRLARFENGDAALLAAPIGAGRVVLAAFSPVREATDLVLRACFVPFVNETAAYAAGGRSPTRSTGARNFTVGDTVWFSARRSGREALAEIVAPWGGKPIEVSIAPGAERFAYRPFFPGNYLVRAPGSGPEAGFSVNVREDESQFERMPPEEIVAAVRGAVVAKDLSDRPVRRIYGGTRGARELFDILLVVAIAVLVLEEYLANRLYREPASARE